METTTTETRQDAWKREREEERVNNLKMAEHVKKTLSDALDSEYKVKLLFSEEEKTPHVEITHDSLEFFKVQFYFGGYARKDKSSCYFENQKTFHDKAGKYSDGSTKWQSDRYEMDYKLTNEELEAIGLTKTNYQIRMSQLNFEFKALKNPMLIINDFKPKLEQYKKIVELAEPRIKKARENKLDIHSFINQIADAAKTWRSETLEERSFDFPFGEVTINDYGTITLNKNLTRQELLELIAKNKVN